MEPTNEKETDITTPAEEPRSSEDNAPPPEQSASHSGCCHTLAGSALIGLYTFLIFFFLIHQGYILLVFPQLADNTTIGELGTKRFVKLRAEVISDIERPGKDSGPLGTYSRFLIFDRTGIADVQFALPWMGRPISKVNILGSVVYRGNIVTINAVRVAGMYPLQGLAIMALCFVLAAWLSYLSYLSKR